MAKLRDRIGISRQALETLREVLAEPVTPIVRDASIQRFEYTFEAVWKAAKAHLFEFDRIEAASPKATVRGCRDAGILEDASARTAMEMAEDRNLTSHTYNQGLADLLYSRLPGYLPLLEGWLERLAERERRLSAAERRGPAARRSVR